MAVDLPGPDPDPPHRDVLRMFALSEKPALSATDLHERLDMTPEGARTRLKKLEGLGLLHSGKAGKRTQIYWLSQKGREEVAQQPD